MSNKKKERLGAGQIEKERDRNRIHCTHTHTHANTQDTLAQKVHLPETLTLEVVDGMDLQENHKGITNFDPGNTPLV